MDGKVENTGTEKSRTSVPEFQIPVYSLYWYEQYRETQPKVVPLTHSAEENEHVAGKYPSLPFAWVGRTASLTNGGSGEGWFSQSLEGSFPAVSKTTFAVVLSL